MSKGKYNSDRDQALHYLTCIGWGNAGFGDVNEYGVHVTRISNYRNDVARGNTEFNSLMDDGAGVTDSTELREQMTGYFLVTETNNGSVVVVEYDAEYKLIAAYESAEQTYKNWLNEVEAANKNPELLDVIREHAYGTIAHESSLTIMPTPHGAKMPGHWREETDALIASVLPTKALRDELERRES